MENYSCVRWNFEKFWFALKLRKKIRLFRAKFYILHKYILQLYHLLLPAFTLEARTRARDIHKQLRKDMVIRCLPMALRETWVRRFLPMEPPYPEAVVWVSVTKQSDTVSSGEIDIFYINNFPSLFSQVLLKYLLNFPKLSNTFKFLEGFPKTQLANKTWFQLVFFQATPIIINLINAATTFRNYLVEFGRF